MKNIRHSCEGITLVEVMVALFVLGVGLLGVIALQAETLKLNRQSYSSTQALFLANDIAERMRVNKDTFVNKFDAGLPDITTWQADVAQRLPGGEGSVTASAGAFDVVVKYDEQALHNELRTADSKQVSYALTVRL